MSSRIELSEVITDIAAGPFGSNLKVACFVEKGFPIIDGANLKGYKVTDNLSKFVTEEKARSLPRSIAKRGDVVVTISGTLGQIAYIPFSSTHPEYLCSQRQFRVTFDTNRVYVPYLVFYFHTREGQAKILSFANQTGVPALSQPTKNFKRIELNLPDIATQKKIARYGELLLDRIELNQRIIDYLTALSKAILQHHVYAELPYGITTVQDFTVAMSNGTTPKRGNESFWADGTIPWVKTGEVNNNLIFKTAERITDLALEKTSLRILPKDAVVMALYGSGTAGRLALLQVPATTNQACTSMVCESAAESFYLFVTLQGMYREIDNLTRGSVQQNLSKDIVASLKIPNVTEAFLEKFGLSTIYAAIAANSKAILLLEEYRDALLPRLMSGEIDVSQVDLAPLNNHLS